MNSQFARRHSILLAAAALLAALAPASAQTPVAITNSGFEDPVLTDGNLSSGSIPGWSAFNSGTLGVLNPSSADLTAEAPVGQNVGLITSSSIEDGMTQTLVAQFQSDTSYTLTVRVANSKFTGGFPGYRVQLAAGGTILAEEDNTQTVAEDSVVTVTLNYTYNAGLHAGVVGQALQIRLLSKGLVSGEEMAFDDVQLTLSLPDPVASSGGPYTVLSGTSLVLDGSASLPSTGATITAYDWDLNNDDIFGDVTGASPAAINDADLVGTWGMSLGANTIKLRVTDSAAKTAVAPTTVTRQVNANLSSLAPSAGTLTPAFDSGTISYTATVSYATTDITVTPTAASSLATITVDGTPVVSGNPSGSISLSVGANVITTVVTGEDLVTTKTYTLTVTRETPNVDLSGLAPSAGTLAPAFASGTISYTASVPYGTSSITVTPTAVNGLATITVNGNPVVSGNPSGSISLSVGANVITTVVTGEDLVTTKTYTLTVTRETPNVDLSGLVPSAGTLAPAFASGTISYTASVPTATTDITVTPTAVNPSATITVNGNTVASGNPSGTIALSLGSNSITTVVTAEDLVTTKTYTLTVIRGPKTLFSSGTKTWNTTTANWGTVTGGPYNTAIWSNSDGGDSATLQGTAGTVTLGEAINIKTLSLTGQTGSNRYTITGSTLNFSSGGTITVAGTNTTNNVDVAFINSAITGSPTVSASGFTNGNTQIVLAPASGSQTLGKLGGGVIYKLSGTSTGNSFTGTASATNGDTKIQVLSGASWTMTGVASGYEHVIGGTLFITGSGSLRNTHRDTTLSSTGILHWNTASAIQDVNINTSRDRDFRIDGGSVDNTSGAAINSSTHNPQMRWNGNWTFIGSNGANSNLNMGNGNVFLTGNRQVTVTNADTTLTVGGVIANLDATARSLTKAGAGTLLLSGASTYTGSTTINAGTLKMGANNVIPNASNVTIGNATLDANTRTDTAGTLDVTGAANINLGVGAAIAFADSELVDWTGGTLNITGTLGATSLRFGDTLSQPGLTPAQLAVISVNGSGTGTYVLDADGYLIPGGGGPGPVNSFVISAISSPQTVGTPITGITITAKDASNATATSFTGTVTFGGTGGFTGTSATFTAGVLNGVSVTPTVAGSNLTFTVDDGASHTGATTITTIQTQYQAWAGGALFDADANGDGVSNGLAFLLGAGGPNVAVTLPTVTQSGGDLVLSNFSCRNLASRGTATLSVQHSSDLGIGDPWTTVLVPEATAAEVSGVSYNITPGDPLNTVNTATISVSQSAAGKLFGRLKAEQP